MDLNFLRPNKSNVILSLVWYVNHLIGRYWFIKDLRISGIIFFFIGFYLASTFILYLDNNAHKNKKRKTHLITLIVYILIADWFVLVFLHRPDILTKIWTYFSNSFKTLSQ